MIQFPTPMRREEVELLACEKEIHLVKTRIKELTHELKFSSEYMKELLDEHEVLKDAVENGKEILFFEDEWDD